MVVTLLALGACFESMDEALFIVDAEAVDEIHVLAKDATVELVGTRTDDEIRVVATRTFSLHSPRVTVQNVDGQLRVSHSCRGQRVCEVHYVITMPRELDAEVVSDGGSVLATQLWGDLEIGTVWGDVSGLALRSSDVQVTTDLGEVTLAFEAAPQRVRVTTVEGNATISVPDDEEYLLELDTERGETSLVNLSSDPDAERSIGVVTEGGNITMRGTLPVTDSEEDEPSQED